MSDEGQPRRSALLAGARRDLAHPAAAGYPAFVTEGDAVAGGWLEGAQARWQRWRRRLRRRAARQPRPVSVLPYLGYGTAERLVVRGRVLEGALARAAAAGDGPLRNVRNALLRFETDEVAGATLEVAPAARPDLAVRTVTDDEGYFRAVVDAAAHGARLAVGGAAAGAGAAARGEVEVRVRLVDPVPPPGSTDDVAGRALVVTEATRFVVISDLDDTVLVTRATRPLRVLRDALFGNARTRRAFAGVAALYRAFEDAGGLVAYVSSGPWNLYDLLQQFLVLNGIPVGPMVLRDWGVDAAALPTRHLHHKVREAEELLTAMPEVRVVLFGDSGQEDPEIYAALVERQPSRVGLVLIRDVGADARRERQIAHAADRCAALGVPFALVPDSVSAAEAAARHGWLPPSAIDAVRRATRQPRDGPPLPSSR